MTRMRVNLGSPVLDIVAINQSNLPVHLDVNISVVSASQTGTATYNHEFRMKGAFRNIYLASDFSSFWFGHTKDNVVIIANFHLDIWNFLR